MKPKDVQHPGSAKYNERLLNPKPTLDYIRSVLKLGHTLSGLLLERDLTEGSIVTRLPPSADVQQLYDFEVGGKVSATSNLSQIPIDQRVSSNKIAPSSRSIDEDMALFIHERLQDSPQRICLFEDWLANPTDAWLRNIRSDHVTYWEEDEVYHVLFAYEVDIEKIVETLRWSYYEPVTVGVLSYTAVPDRARLEPTAELLASLAADADFIMIGAYDGEGYVIWSSQDAPFRPNEENAG